MIARKGGYEVEISEVGRERTKKRRRTDKRTKQPTVINIYIDDDDDYLLDFVMLDDN